MFLEAIKTMEKETIIDKYFKNSNNVNVAKNIYCNDKKVTAEYFYSLNEIEQDGVFVLMKKIMCKDGFSMSVQANFGYYCNPRITIRSCSYNFYDEFEVGFPSEKEELLLKYAENKKNLIETIYAYVPKEIINKIIEKHGGLK